MRSNGAITMEDSKLIAARKSYALTPFKYYIYQEERFVKVVADETSGVWNDKQGENELTYIGQKRKIIKSEECKGKLTCEWRSPKGPFICQKDLNLEDYFYMASKAEK